MSSSASIIVYGLPESVYCAIVMLVLKHKNVPYQLHTVDVFDSTVLPEEYLARHPFGKIPVLHHGDFELYETRAIIRYIDDYWPEPPLQPHIVRDRASMEQIISILDSYAYKAMVWDVYVQIMRGLEGDQRTITHGLSQSEICLRAITELQCNDQFLVGSSLSLADSYAYPMVKYLSLVEQACELLLNFPSISAWFESMEAMLALTPQTPVDKTP